MMKAYIFPGQGAQFPGMGKDLYESCATAKDLFEQANDILGFRITDIMFDGSEEDLVQTKVTQPSIYLYSVILSKVKEDLFAPDMVAGHSLGEFSALAAAKAISFEDGLKLVAKRAMLMQEACVAVPSTMAAVVKVEADVIETALKNVKDEIVVIANYNSPGQTVISGTIEGVRQAAELLKNEGAKVLPLKVGGAFHSPLMKSAKDELEQAILKTPIKQPICPIYQNVNGLPVSNPDIIKSNLVMQLTSPVRWTQTVQNMIANGVTNFIEVGPGKVLQGLVKKIKVDAVTDSL